MAESTDIPILSEEHYAAIGQVVVKAAVTQHLMAMAAFSLAANEASPWHEDIAYGVLITGMGAQTLVGMLKTLGRIRHEEDADEFDKLLDKINKAFSRRDTFAHAAWARGKRPNSAQPLLAKTVGRLRKTQEVDYTPKEILKWAETFGRLSLALMMFLGRWNLVPETTPQTET